MNKLAENLIIDLRRRGLSANRIVYRLRTLDYKTSEEQVIKLLKERGEWKPLGYKAQPSVYAAELEK